MNDSLYATVLTNHDGQAGFPQSGGGSSTGSRFEIVRPHAAGGLGQVSVAIDHELHREVALKEIRPCYADHPESRARFLLEAEITGGLEHPGVVPVYGMGTCNDGRPYYAMRFIRGESLQQAIEELHGGEPAERMVRLRGLLRRFIEVANAVAYAHSRGVLHRDLKPANVMLGPYGETLVVDWGLAKPVDRPAQATAAAESRLLPPAAHDSDVTRIGRAIGTPAYMSPEQAAGAVDLIGRASDIYSLGATLYSLLTGQPPVQGRDVDAIQKRVLRGEFAVPRAVQSWVPRPLEAICLKAMALEPADRYRSARALAEDVERWLADAPVQAHRENAAERLARWMRRHRTWSQAGAAALLVVTLVAATAAVMVHRAGLQAQQAHELRALAQVELLRNASPEAVPAILDNLRPFHHEVAPRLHELLAGGDLTPREAIRVNLALLADEPGRAAHLATRLLDCELDDLPLIRQRLSTSAATIEPLLWQTLRDTTAAPTARFHAGLTLAGYAPQAEGWERADLSFLVKELLVAHVDDQRMLRDLLRPVSARLLEPIQRAFLDLSRREHVRHAAATALADWGRGRPELLARLAADARGEQFAPLMAALAAEPDRDAARRTLLDIVGLHRLEWDAEEPRRIVLGRRRAAAAVTLLRLGERETIGELFTPTTDPDAPAQFLAAVRDHDLEPAALAGCLNTARGDAARYWLILALGEFTAAEVPDGSRFSAQLVDWYRCDPSSAMHGACGWLLRCWGFGSEVDEFDATAASGEPSAPSRAEWFVERAGPFTQTMIVFAPGAFRMGSPPTELDRNNDESAHEVRLTRGFAMMDRLVTRDQYQRFLAETRGEAAACGYIEAVAERSPAGWQPAVAFNWFDAVRFCRWLTTAAGLPESEQCYDDPATLELGPGESSADGQWPFHPERAGYRLPTEAEWEYACRAGTVTAYSFGSDVDLAPRFGWFQGDSRGEEHYRRVLRPNPRGLRNMHGNNSEWCHDWLAFDPGAGRVDPTGPANGQCRVVRGGSYLSRPALARSASRSGLPPTFASPSAGLRVVRTMNSSR